MLSPVCTSSTINHIWIHIEASTIEWIFLSAPALPPLIALLLTISQEAFCDELWWVESIRIQNETNCGAFNLFENMSQIRSSPQVRVKKYLKPPPRNRTRCKTQKTSLSSWFLVMVNGECCISLQPYHSLITFDCSKLGRSVLQVQQMTK